MCDARWRRQGKSRSVFYWKWSKCIFHYSKLQLQLFTDQKQIWWCFHCCSETNHFRFTAFTYSGLWRTVVDFPREQWVILGNRINCQQYATHSLHSSYLQPSYLTITFGLKWDFCLEKNVLCSKGSATFVELYQQMLRVFATSHFLW